MADTRPNYSTPSAVRSVTSYPARRGFKQAVDPALDHVVGVEDAIDIHCHAHEGQQDALGVAKLASKSGMQGYSTRRSWAGRIRRDGRRRASCVGILVRGERFDAGACLGRQLGHQGFFRRSSRLVGQDAERGRHRALDAQQHVGQYALDRRQTCRLGQDRRSNAQSLCLVRLAQIRPLSSRRQRPALAGDRRDLPHGSRPRCGDLFWPSD